VLLEGEPVVYPPEAIAAKAEGRMTVKCTLNIQGRLVNCQVQKSVPLLEEAVLASLASRRYTPATQQDLPVAIDYIININLVPPR
jgi:TonB family protein